MISNPKELIPKLDELGYVIDEELATVIYLMLKLEKPLLLEGNPGVGKTEAAYILSTFLQTELIRLQCYEGLDVNAAVYEWNYQKQLLAIKIQEQSNLSTTQKEELIFSDDYLLKRPLLRAITSIKPPVLLIDEIDRADEEFEAFLLELLSAFQITIPELGTVKAESKPFVILTSNRTRELSDALKRRCLYYWVPYPSEAKELKIIKKHLPDIEEKLALQMVRTIQKVRALKLDKSPGIAETIDWAKGILAMHVTEINNESLEKTLSCIVKSKRDLSAVREEIHNLLTR